MTSDHYRPSETTRLYWRRQRHILRAASLPFLIVFAVEVIGLRRNVALLVLVILLSTFVMLGLFAYARPRRLSDARSGEVWWQGSGWVDVRALTHAGLSESMTTRSMRRLNLWTQGRGRAGGVMSVGPAGMRWTFGLLARLAGVGGAAEIPWSKVVDLEVGRHASSSWSGGIRLKLEGGQVIDGGFMDRSGRLKTELENHQPCR